MIDRATPGVYDGRPVWIRREMMCCAAKEWEAFEKPNGVCEDCGSETIDDEAYEGCYYSPVECSTCGWQPCDGSC